MKTTAVVLGRNYTSRLGMIRAAGMQDCDVIVVRTANRANTEEYDRASRYVRGYHAVDEQEKDRLLEVLMGLEPCSGGSGKMVLLPTDDVAASFVDTHLNELMTKFHCPHVIGADPLEGAAVRFMDKRFQKGLAAEAGLKSAKGWTLEFVLREAADQHQGDQEGHAQMLDQGGARKAPRGDGRDAAGDR